MRDFRKGFGGGLLLLSLMIATGVAEAQVPAFPGAEGFAKYITGGRGGAVLAVTTLVDNPANPPEGSLRWVLDQAMDTLPHPFDPERTYTTPKPLTVVFRVSGIIELQDELEISRDNLTLAGQTAPGDGICLRNYWVKLRSENVIIRYLRFRPGLGAGASKLEDGIEGLNVENCKKIMVDHCSFSWANEECAIFYDNRHTTVQWCIASEGLRDAGHKKGLRSYGGVWGGEYASIHHNLIAHNWSRTIRFNGARSEDKNARVDYRNNVIYNWGRIGACYGGELWEGQRSSWSNMVNNYYKSGPATPDSLLFIEPGYDKRGVGPGRWHLDGNYMFSSPEKTDDNWLGVSKAKIPSEYHDFMKSNEPFRMEEPLPTETAEEAFLSVMDMVGAVYPKRDTVDARVIYETMNGTATGSGVFGMEKGIIDTPDSVGGYPEYLTYDVPADADEDGMDDDWELANGLDPADPEDRNDLHESGYTMLEVYINGLVEDYTLILPLVVHVKRVREDMCLGGDPVSMLGSPRGGNFEAGDGFSVYGDSLVFSPENTGDYSFKYVWSDGEGFADSVTEVISVHSLPEASVTGLDTSYTVGDRDFLDGDPVGGTFLDGPGITVMAESKAMFLPTESGEYEVFYRYTDQYGCFTDASATTTVYPSTGTSDLPSHSSLRIYPNPAGDLVRIDSDAGISTVSIYNIAGVLVREMKMSGDPVVSIDGIDRGVYFMRIATDKETAVRRFVKL